MWSVPSLGPILFFSKPLAYFLKTFGKVRRKIAEKNLEVCFPELSQLERSKILNKHFLHLGASIFNGFKAWIQPYFLTD